MEPLATSPILQTSYFPVNGRRRRPRNCTDGRPRAFVYVTTVPDIRDGRTNGNARKRERDALRRAVATTRPTPQTTKRCSFGLSSTPVVRDVVIGKRLPRKSPKGGFSKKSVAVLVALVVPERRSVFV